jgi:hypothetical protein
MGFTSQANSTWVLAVTPAPTLTDNGTPWGTNIAPGFFIAPTLGAAESIQLAYNGTTYASAVLCEYPGQLVVDAVGQVATGTAQLAQSNTVAATAGDIVINYGWQTTSNYLNFTLTAGFAVEPPTTSLYIADELVTTTGNVSAGANWSGAVNFTEGIVALKPVLPASAPVTLNLTTKVVFCVKCDRTDDTPAQGSLAFAQNGFTNAFTFASDGSVSVNVTFLMTTDPVVFTVFYQNASGQQAKGAGWTWSIPRASFSAGVATLGTLSFGGVAFTLNSDGSISFAGFLPTS